MSEASAAEERGPVLRRAFDPPRELYPFEDHWLVRGVPAGEDDGTGSTENESGTAMHYLDVGPEGEGGSGAASSPPAVLMLHGNPTWSFLYREVIRRLSPACLCIAPDYPGFGLSGHPPGYGYTPEEHAEWVAALVDELELERFVLLAQDWGGPIGLSVAARWPERVAGLVLANTWCWPPDLRMRIFSWIMGGPLGRWLHLRRNFFARRLVPLGILRREKKTPKILAAYTAPFPNPASRRGTWVFPRAIRTSAPWLRDLERRLGVFRAKPVELVWGTQDLALGQEAVIDRWLRIFPEAGVERLADAAHYLQEDRPDALEEAVLRVLDRGD